MAAYAAEAAQRQEHPGLVGYERLARIRGWPSRSTVTARLGPWTDALAAAGVAPSRLQRGGERAVDCALDQFLEQMAAGSLYPAAHRYRKLAPENGWPSLGTVIARYGSWSAVLLDKGLSVRRSRSLRTSRDECLAALRSYIQLAAERGEPVGTRGYDQMARSYGWPDRQHTILPRFGSWAEALRSAGFSGPVRSRRITVSRCTCLAAVRSYLCQCRAAGRRPTMAGYAAIARAQGWPAMSTVLARFGTWTEAFTAAEAARPGPFGAEGEAAPHVFSVDVRSERRSTELAIGYRS